jgi:hypothetical protein
MADLNPYHILLKEQDFDCDTEFDVQGELMGGHSDIIEPSSSVLAAMIRSEKRVRIEDVESEVFSQILYFIYSGKILLNSEVFSVCDEDGILQRILKVDEKYALIPIIVTRENPMLKNILHIHQHITVRSS